MSDFLGKDFLLKTETAKRLYKDYADMRKVPVIDYHCHINPQEIYEDRHFDNITQVWLGGDHYKWRQMRTCGIDEKYITGDAVDYEKFEKWCEVLPRLIGNPLYIWSHMELQYYFGYMGSLCPKTCKEVWDITKEKLSSGELTARSLITSSNVKVICTTDDPIDDLHWHKLIAEDESFDVQVLPAWRPDKAMNIEKPSFCDYIAKLSEVSEVNIESIEALKGALVKRMDYFESRGCKVSDHGLEYVMYNPVTEAEVDIILKKALSGGDISREEELGFKTYFMEFMGRECHRRGWVMQLHYGCKRDNNTYMYDLIGVDTGFDAINDYTPSAKLADFLNSLALTNQIPKTIVYSLNPTDNAAIGTIIGCFQGGGIKNRIQQGSAWWFNDHIDGMRDQLRSLAATSSLAGFVGMLTDSRSFLSYTRHDLFRRILCDLIGEYVENGEYPDDDELLASLIQDISYRNVVEYFGFEI